jgi:hypothetical protein
VSAALRTVAFGDPNAGVWGKVLVQDEQPAAFVALGAGADAATFTSLVLEGSDDAEQWRLRTGDAELTIAPAGTAVGSTRIAGFDQLCRVTGAFVTGGSEHRVDSLGHRAARSIADDAARFESIREVCAWFESGDGLALVSLRPRRARGHDADLVAAALLDADDGVAVADPRLSTTYTAAGSPSRVSLELWTGAEDEQFPRRAAGEAVGARARQASGGSDVLAELLSWHSRGADGTGVYLLARWT